MFDVTAGTGVLVISRGLGTGEVLAAAHFLYAVGIAAIEVTMDSPGALESIETLAREMEGQMIVGAGTVLTRDELLAAKGAGAKFIICPHFDRELVRVAAEAGLPIVPGALTPTEILTAWRAGAAAVKVFPAATMGPDYIRQLRGPLGFIPLLPTGGVTADNAKSFVAAGAFGVAVGGGLMSSKLRSDPGLFKQEAARLLAAVREGRGHGGEHAGA